MKRERFPNRGHGFQVEDHEERKSERRGGRKTEIRVQKAGIHRTWNERNYFEDQDGNTLRDQGKKVFSRPVNFRRKFNLKITPGKREEGWGVSQCVDERGSERVGSDYFQCIGS